MGIRGQPAIQKNQHHLGLQRSRMNIFYLVTGKNTWCCNTKAIILSIFYLIRNTAWSCCHQTNNYHQYLLFDRRVCGCHLQNCKPLWKHAGEHAFPLAKTPPHLSHTHHGCSKAGNLLAFCWGNGEYEIYVYRYTYGVMALSHGTLPKVTAPEAKPNTPHWWWAAK